MQKLFFFPTKGLEHLFGHGDLERVIDDFISDPMDLTFSILSQISKMIITFDFEFRLNWSWKEYLEIYNFFQYGFFSNSISIMVEIDVKVNIDMQTLSNLASIRVDPISAIFNFFFWVFAGNNIKIRRIWGKIPKQPNSKKHIYLEFGPVKNHNSCDPRDGSFQRSIHFF